MDKNSKIYVAGHNGLVGSSIVRCLVEKGYKNIITADKSSLNLMNHKLVEDFFLLHKPEYVFLAAAKVGGIIANKSFPVDFIYQNLEIQNTVITNSYNFGVKKLLFLGSSCIYPKYAKQPIRESAILTGELESTNLSYAVAKIAGKVLCDAYRSQYGFNAFTVMPSNVYGPGDNFHPENSHVVAGLMRRIHEANKNNYETVEVWGTGNPSRELIFVDDLADACIKLMKVYDHGGLINVGTSIEYTIQEIAEAICEVVGYKGKLKFDTSKPDGTPRKIMDNSKLKAIGWLPKVSLNRGLKRMYASFKEEHER